MLNPPNFEHGLTITLSSLLLIYHQLFTWGPFFPWNDTEKLSRKDILLDASINGILMGVGLYCLMKENVGFYHSFPLIYYPILFVGECLDWWLPYFSPSFARARKIWD